jgi:hypothetical protein
VAQWRREGLTDTQMKSLIRSGDLVHVRRGVYATRLAVEFSKERGGDHLLLAVGAQRMIGRSVISHHSAARVYGFDMLYPPPKDVVTVTLRPGKQSPGRTTSGVIKYKADLPDGHVRKEVGVQLTTPERTVVDIARGSTFMQGVAVADSALRAHAAPKPVTEEVLGYCAHWPGVEAARRAVEFSDMRSESVLESCARVVFHTRGVEPPELQVNVASGIRVDFCWPRQRVIAESDGLGKYEQDAKRKIAEQIRRDNALRRLGYTVIHFTWDDLFSHPEVVVADILRALAQAR